MRPHYFFRYYDAISDEPLEATTLEDIGFDGDPLHPDESYGCHVLCNDACHVGNGKHDAHREHFYVWRAQQLQQEHEEQAREAARREIDEIVRQEIHVPRAPRTKPKSRPDEYYTTVQAPDSVIAAARSALDFAYYVLQRKQRVARDLDELWAWANTPHPSLEDMTPNYALLNGRSDVAWALMRGYLW